ncbi:PAS domain-containing hybrid sensor histidine kinase/response regulator [Thiorhodovibrio frisius]|uniref:Sensory/regulatory protein RpfC n=1 Tax=Thiorhodovibrio frisius TaxID=631362 RepID=H8YXS5_9GAMM|nr:PAS domain-containing hybrid sensor histidine kinase/response regulator [Thiorhodovibrio frisius]EIC23251.1 PAS domain S-box [Thiorhodovibrio frisius]WPL23673.1 Signal transduction histidine-protein kinase BarA [Thiorhodovibrio frisius]
MTAAQNPQQPDSPSPRKASHTTAAVTPLQQALVQFVTAHPGLATPALADAFGLPLALCQQECTSLQANGLLADHPLGGWRASSGRPDSAETKLPTGVNPRYLAMLFEQSLDGLFFMMLDEPVCWDDSVDKERVLDQVFEHQRLTHANQAMCRQYAAQPEQLIGLRPADFFAHDLAEGRRQWRQLFDTGRLHTETDERRFDGSPVFIEGDYRCLYDHRGRILGHFGVQRDMTERKLAQRRLAESEARFRDIIASTADFIWEVDRSGRFSFVAGEIEELLGYRPDELIGCAPFEFMDADEGARIQSIFEAARAEGRALGKHENWLKTKQGGARCFAFAGVPVFDDHGELVGYRGLNRDVTEQKQADESLRLSEQRLRALFEMSPESIVILDPETTLPLQFNRLAHERLGYTADEFARLPIAAYEANEDAEAVRAHVERIARTGRDDFETRHRCRDGHIMTAMVSVQLTEIAGSPFFYAMYRDITELRGLSERLLLATGAGGIGIWEWEINGETLSWDEQMYRLYGLPVGDGQEPYTRWYFALCADDRARMDAQLKQALDAQDGFDSEFRILRNGELCWLRVAARIIRDANAKPVRMIGCNWDVTDTRLAEERMAREEARFRGAFEIAPNGMALVDGAGRWLQVNQALCDILGYSAEELLARDFQSISHPDDLPADLVALEQLVSGATDQVHLDKRYLHKDGHIVPILLTSSAVRDESGRLTFTVNHVLDLTERRASEAAMLAAKEAAEAANRAKSEFLANMSHEIRTPLNAVIGLTELTLSTELDARQRDYLDKVRHSSRALLGILNDILDYSKIEAGRVMLEQTQFRLEDLLEQLTALFQAAAEAKGLDLFYRIAPQVPRQLIGDPMRLGQVLNNLVGNAVKFTEQGQVELAIRVVSERDERIELSFSVRDSGIGMAADTIERLFQAFTQADGSITRRYGGTGLGLTISQRLVRLMGGTIKARSAPEQGSTFCFHAEFKLPERAAARIGAPPHAIGQSRILIVDKRPAARQLLAEILQSWRMTLLEASSCPGARQAIAQAAAAGQPVDLVLLEAKQCLDCRFCPVAAPPAPAEGLPPRALGDPPTPVVLMVSSIEQAQLLARGDSSELPRLLAKPVTPSALFDAIANVTQAQRPVRAYAAEANPGSLSPLQGVRVLVAEDNRINQMVVEGILCQIGASVTLATNGREAADLALQQDFDVVLMDLQMPLMDGYAATEAIRAHNPDVPIIALTAAALETDRERCLAAGMNDHLSKPVIPAHLIEVMTRWIKLANTTGKLKTGKQATAEAARDETTQPPLAEQDVALGIDPEQLTRLRQLLADSEYVSPELLGVLRQNASPAALRILTRVEQALDAFDYESAADTLAALTPTSRRRQRT